MRDLRRVSAAIFDLDGTILDSSGIWDGLAERFLQSRGLTPQPGLSQLLGSMTLAEGSRFLRDNYPLTEDPEQIQARLLGIIADFYRNECQLKPGAARLIEAVKGCGISAVIATAGDRDLSAAALKRLGLLDYFSGILTCGEYGGKNQPGIFLAAAALAGASPDCAAVFEDSLSAVVTAKSTGFLTAAVKDISEPRQTLLQRTADYYRADLSGYIEFFGR